MNSESVHRADVRRMLAWLGDQPRHPYQTHRIDESDAEVVQIRSDLFVAISTDAVAEEIAVGLYRDPYTAGWVTAVNALSDIAAVGAEIVGVVWCSLWDPRWDTQARAAAAGGLADALRACGTALLGGDSGTSQGTVLAATAVGVCTEQPMSRIGAQAGDVLCVTGPTGRGAALAARYMAGEPQERFPEHCFRPTARLDAGLALRGLASACTDASDGLIQAVDVLTSLNGVGAELRWDPGTVDKVAADYLRDCHLPLWLAWLSEISDFQLVATVPPESWHLASAVVPSLLPLGRLTRAPDVTVEVDGRRIDIDVAEAGRVAQAAPEERQARYAELIAAIRERGLP